MKYKVSLNNKVYEVVVEKGQAIVMAYFGEDPEPVEEEAELEETEELGEGELAIDDL